MATAADTLITRFVLDDQFSKKAPPVIKATKDTTVSMGLAAETAKGLNEGYSKLTHVLGLAAAAMGGLAAEIAGVVVLSKTAAEFDALNASLIAVEGNSKRARKELEALQGLAMAPGLGFEEAVRSYTMLRNAGLESGFAKELIKQFANANARAGGGPQEFGLIMAQVSQSATKPFLQGEELMTMSEHGIPAFKILKDAFGTSDTEELKRRGIGAKAALAALVIEMQKLERVSGSDKNSFDNLGDAIHFAEVSAGQAVNRSFRPMAETLGDLVQLANDGNVFQELGDSLAGILSMDDSTLESAFVNILALMKTGIDLASILKNSLFNMADMLAPVAGWTIRNSPLASIANASELFDANKTGIEADLALGRAKQKARDKRGPDVTISVNDLSKIASEKTSDAVERTANATETLVGLQRDQMQLERRILGGGTIGAAALNPVKLSQAMHGTLPGTNRHERKILEGIRDLIRENLGALESRYSPVSH